MKDGTLDRHAITEYKNSEGLSRRVRRTNWNDLRAAILEFISVYLMKKNVYVFNSSISTVEVVVVKISF